MIQITVQIFTSSVVVSPSLADCEDENEGKKDEDDHTEAGDYVFFGEYFHAVSRIAGIRKWCFKSCLNFFRKYFP